jgi:hypothetical protein
MLYDFTFSFCIELCISHCCTRSSSTRPWPERGRLTSTAAPAPAAGNTRTLLEEAAREASRLWLEVRAYLPGALPEPWNGANPTAEVAGSITRRCGASLVTASPSPIVVRTALPAEMDCPRSSWIRTTQARGVANLKFTGLTLNLGQL